LKHNRLTTSHLGNRYVGNKTVWKQIGCQLHIFKCIRTRTWAQSLTLRAYLCVQTTTWHEYLSAAFTSPYHMHNSAPCSHLYITHVQERYNCKLGRHKSKTNW